MYFSAHNYQKVTKALIFLLFLSPNTLFADSSDMSLPDFGDSAGSVISPTYEQRLGQVILTKV